MCPPLLILSLATLAAYANTFAGDFQFDDFANILEDPHLEGVSVFLSHLDHSIRPVLKLTFLLDRHLYGSRAGGYHVINLLLHLASVLLVYAVLRKIVRLAPSESASSERITMITALLFAIHPVGTETVTYLSGRATGLMAFSYLSALYLVLRSWESKREGRRGRLTYVAALVCFTLSLFSKEVSVTFPVVLLLLQVVFRRGSAETQGEIVRFHAPFWIIVSVFALIGASHPRYSYLLHFSLRLQSSSDFLVSQINAVVHALGLFVRPSQLNFDHDLPIYRSLVQWPIPLEVVALLGLLMLAILCTKRVPCVTFGLLWFFIQLAPTNSVLPRYDLLSERNLYLPSVGLYLACASFAFFLARQVMKHPETSAYLGRRLLTAGRWTAKAAALVVCLLLIHQTVNRNTVYASAVTFWTDAVKKSPHKARSHNNLGYAYYKAGDFDRALQEFRIALRLDRYEPSAHRNMRSTWDRIKERDER